MDLQAKAKDLLVAYSDIFSKTDMDMGTTKLVKHHMNLVCVSGLYARGAQFQKFCTPQEVNMLLVILFTKFEDSICRQPTDHSDGSVDVSNGSAKQIIFTKLM